MQLGRKLAEGYAADPEAEEIVSPPVVEAPDDARVEVETVAEPFLVREGLLGRTPRGRVATPATWRHLGLRPPRPAGTVQPDLLEDQLEDQGFRLA